MDRHTSTPSCDVSIARAFLTLATENLARTVAFYTAFLGQSPFIFEPDRYAEYRLPGLSLGIFQPKPNHWPEFSQGQQSPLSLCLQVEDLQTAIAHITTMGYPPPGAVQSVAHGDEIYAYDPDGNRLILYQPRS